LVCFDPLLDQLWLIEAQNPGRVHSFIARSLGDEAIQVN